MLQTSNLADVKIRCYQGIFLILRSLIYKRRRTVNNLLKLQMKKIIKFNGERNTRKNTVVLSVTHSVS